MIHTLWILWMYTTWARLLNWLKRNEGACHSSQSPQKNDKHHEFVDAIEFANYSKTEVKFESLTKMKLSTLNSSTSEWKRTKVPTRSVSSCSFECAIFLFLKCEMSVAISLRNVIMNQHVPMKIQMIGRKKQTAA